MYRYRYAVDTFLILCYPNKFPIYSCFTKTMRGGDGRQCYLDNKLKMFFNASYHAVSKLITELRSLLYLLNKLNPTSDVATFAESAIYIWHIFATKRDSLSQ